MKLPNGWLWWWFGAGRWIQCRVYSLFSWVSDVSIVIIVKCVCTKYILFCTISCGFARLIQFKYTHTHTSMSHLKCSGETFQKYYNTNIDKRPARVYAILLETQENIMMGVKHGRAYLRERTDQQKKRELLKKIRLTLS